MVIEGRGRVNENGRERAFRAKAVAGAAQWTQRSLDAKIKHRVKYIEWTETGTNMAHRVCPWWLGYFLLNPFRRLSQSPKSILSPFVAEGMTVLEPGCGMGFFTLELARLVGPRGMVIAVDLQPKMLDGLRKRARKSGLLDRIEPRQASPDGLNIADLAGKIDFVLAFSMVHELPDPRRFFAELRQALRPGRQLLFAEPRGHVKEQDFHASVAAAERAGLRVQSWPRIRWSRAALLTPA